MNEYRHTQVARLLVTVYVVCFIVFVVGLGLLGMFQGAAVAFAFLFLALFTFLNLTTVVNERGFWCEFYLGLPRRHIRIERIAGCRIVRPAWYFGWGVRITPRGWLFRVSGLAAVEIELRNGRHFTVGTDEPERLAAAIDEALGATSGVRR